MRQITVGAGGPLIAGLASLAPTIAEPIMAWAAPLLQRDPDGRKGPRADNLHQPGQDLRERAYYRGVRQESLYAAAQMLALVAGLAAAAAFIGGRRLGRLRAKPVAL